MNLQELQEAYRNKEIGKETYDKEIAKLNAIWNRIPEQYQEGIQEGAANTGQFLGGVYSDAREFKPWYMPGENLGALGIRGIEGLGHLSSKYIGQPVSSFAHNQLGIHKPVAGGIGLGAEVVLDPLAVGKLSKLSKSKKLHSLLKYQADSAAYNVGKNVNRIKKDLTFAKEQAEILTGNRLRKLDKPPTTFFDVDTIIDGSPKWARKVTAIYKNHEGGISWKQAMDMAKRHDLQMNIGYGNEIMNTGDNYNYLPNLGPDDLLDIHTTNSKRFTWKDIPGKVLWDKPDRNVISKVDSLLNEMDNWRLSHSHLDRPMTGFVKNHGSKPTFWKNGREYVIGWSRKKGTYEIEDLQKRINRRASRLAGDKTSNPQSASIREIKKAIVRDLNKQTKDLPVEQWDLIIQNPGDAYIEHIIAVKSPYWKSKRGKNSGYLAGDSKNLKVLTDQNFKKLKDNIEKHIHAKHKDYYVDYDPLSQNLVIKNLETGEALPTQIPGYGKASLWKHYVDDTLEGRDMKSLVDVDPDIPPNVARQMENYEKARLTLDKLTDVEQNAILDYANGMSWKQIRAKYGKSINQSNLQLFKKKEYTKSEVLRILKEYKMDGKGSIKFDWLNDPEYFPDE